MDFRGRSQTERTPAQPVTPVVTPAPRSTPFGDVKQSKETKRPITKLFKIGLVTLLFSLTGLVVALTFLLGVGGDSQMKAVAKPNYQAVFLNNGQVYFGNIKNIGANTFDLQNIYYLQTNGTTTAAAATANTATDSNVSLVKLGCELHGPYDRMIINSEQITFWENLRDDSQVVKAIADYKKANANQACSTSAQNTTQQSTSTPAPTATPTATPTTTPTRRP